MADTPRIEELRRRVQKDPASIAFAQLAEEHRRAGDFEEAIRVSRAGLERHQGYLSARVTLGRALVETGQLEEAQAEFEQVLQAAPDNLAAIRGLADIHQRREDGAGAAEAAASAEQTVLPSLPALDEALLGADEEFARALETLDALPRELPGPELDTPQADAGHASPPPPGPDPVLTELEAWLAAIVADRQRRAAGDAF